MRVIAATRRLAALADNAAVPVAVAAMLYGAFIGIKLYVHDFDPSAFVVAGDRACSRGDLPANVRLVADSWGYDGQYYYRIALNPLTSGEREFGVAFDNPVHRHQRILFPLLVWMVCGGSPRFVCWAMLGVNYFGIWALTWFSANYVQRIGRHCLWGLLFPLYPGLLLSSARDLTEVWSAVLIVAALAAARHARWGNASAWLTLAVFARETTVVLTVGMLLAAIIAQCRSRTKPAKRTALLIVPLVVYTLWQLALRWWWQSTVPPPGLASFGPPLYGFLSSLCKCLASDAALTYAELSFIALACGFATNALTSTAASDYERVPFILYVTLAALIGPALWVEDWGFLRMLYEVIFLAFVVLLQARRKALYFSAAYSAALWAYLFGTRWL